MKGTQKMKSETNQKLSKIVLTGHFPSTDDIISEEDTAEIITKQAEANQPPASDLYCRIASAVDNYGHFLVKTMDADGTLNEQNLNWVAEKTNTKLKSLKMAVEKMAELKDVSFNLRADLNELEEKFQDRTVLCFRNIVEKDELKVENEKLKAEMKGHNEKHPPSNS